jgi:prolipoprotein diacylglyceryltransferase
MNVINAIVEHWDTGLAVLGGLVAVATIIVKATPSQKDDSVLAVIVKIADWLSVVNPKAPKV